MANILLLDDNPVAQKAMIGILGRAEHRTFVVENIEDAWKALVRNVAVDLLVIEVKLGSNAQPLNLLRILREHPFFRHLPVLAYTTVTAREIVHQALSLHVQNYLIKPYSDDKVFAEVQRAENQKWRAQLFDDPRSFCAQMEITLEDLTALLKRTRAQVSELGPKLHQILEQQRLDPCAEAIADLIQITEKCGYWGLYDVLQCLINATQEKDWLRVQTSIAAISMADRLIDYHLDPEAVPADFVTQDELEAAEQNRRRELWLGDNVLESCPLADWDDVCRQLNALPGFPVAQSGAATFEMTADGRESSVQPLEDIAGKDPGLAAQVIQMVNQLQARADDPVADPRQAVQMLGGSRLRVLARELPVVPDSVFHAPGLTWQSFWVYQFGCARLCAYMCEFMEIPVFMPQAYWAGLLHDIGKLALASAYPDCIRAAIKLAATHGMSFEDAMKRLICCTPADAGAYLARRCGLPAVYTEVIAHLGHPEDSQTESELVALVTFASQLCLRFKLGASGSVPPPEDLPIEELPGWAILRNRVFPSFDISRFENVLQEWVEDQRSQLTGKSTSVVD